MVDPRAKGARAETVVRDKLRELTKLQWERVPSSGALDPKHGLKGDLYVPNEKNLFSVEVKHYAECQLTTTLFTAKEPLLAQWWQQAERQGKQVNKKPLLIFKHDRSPLFVAFNDYDGDKIQYPHIYLGLGDKCDCWVALFDDWFANEKPKFILE